MTALLAIASLVLIVVVLIQIGKISDLARKIRGEEEVQYATNRVNGTMMLWFMVFFIAFCIWSAMHYKNLMLGYGPLESASAHGGEIDSMFNVTLFFTGIVFLATQIALFYFAWKYRGRKGHKADFYPHDDRLEMLWTGVPAVVMTFLVIRGLIAWNDIMVDIPADAVPGKDYIEVEATGSQFLWYLRYPGPDNKLGARDYRKITATNPLGQDWTDEANLDDFQPTDLVLPVGKPVRVRITSRDVLHNFYLPHFRVKMDAVPGMPTFFVFTPTMTTEEYRRKLGARDADGNPLYPEWWEPSDPNDPNSEPRWKTFNFELACAELCGKGHFSMRKIVRIVTEEEYEQWLKEQQSYYFSTIRGTDEDPWKDRVFPQEQKAREEATSDAGAEQTEEAPAQSE